MRSGGGVAVGRSEGEGGDCDNHNNHDHDYDNDDDDEDDDDKNQASEKMNLKDMKNTKVIVPFLPHHRILLVGEGKYLRNFPVHYFFQ